jgi:tRNA-splicing ligase RtcB
MRIFEGKNVPIASWCNNPEEGAIEQAKNLASLPFIFKAVNLMPDTHQGYGMPIGGVIATEGVVIPNAVGVDIGCGMCAMKTSLTDLSIEQIKKILGGSKEYQGGIRTLIPVGFDHHSKKQDALLMPDMLPLLQGKISTVNLIVYKEYNSALNQIGTLGGGNHFIEIQKGNDGFIWVMIHSGSRNLGYKVAKYYNDLAQSLCKKWYSNIPEFKGEDGLAFFPVDTTEGQTYLIEMNYCLAFAYANRKLMLERIKEAFLAVVNCQFDEEINIHHNYASLENHFGKNVWVHRKGATSAKEGQLGIIPGSQGTSSYIVKGKGNIESFMSCSHGAGRKMSRKKARENLSLEDEQKKLNDQGILHAVRHKSNLDEASGAYKSIETVMDEQTDLVDILIKLQPLAVIKG